MTDFVLSSGDIMRPYRSPWGGFPTRLMPLSTGISSQIIRVGTVVGLDQNTTNGWSQITPSSVSSGCLISTAVVGVAAEGPGAAAGGPSSTNTAGTLIPVWEANPNVEFKARSGHGLLNSTMVGVMKGLYRDSTLNIDLVECGASSLATPIPRVVVTGLLDNSGDSGGLVTFRFCTHDPNSSLSTGRLLAFFV
jgi:hypothetical protein